MREFFRGWKRKLGVVTVVIACVFTAAWVRSLTITDHCRFPVGRAKMACFASNYGYFSFGWPIDFAEIGRPLGWPSANPQRFSWRTYNYREHVSFEDFWLFDFTGQKAKTSFSTPQWIFPYSAFVLFFSPLSAWLLLSKPRPAKRAVAPITTAN